MGVPRPRGCVIGVRRAEVLKAEACAVEEREAGACVVGLVRLAGPVGHPDIEVPHRHDLPTNPQPQVFAHQALVMREVPVGQEPLEEPQPRVVLGEPRRLAPLEVGVPLVGPVFVVLGEPGRAHWIPPVRVELGPLVGWALPAGRAPQAER
ncbi:MAG TPA: hypothetical protein VK054_11625, partial [Beutenbergiaceae bacterium]|nr:hypothetical protein [Beutenbergiaceae bacterium]